MRLWLGYFVVVSVMAVWTVVGEAAQGTRPDLFSGVWKLNAQKSKAATGALPSTEVFTVRVVNGVMTCTLESTTAGQPARSASYTARYNDSQWADARGFDGFSQLKLVTITDRLHYWVMRRSYGQAAGLVMRRMAEDGKSFTAVALGLDGNIQSTREYEKQE